MADHPMTDLSHEQQELWQRVNDLWLLSLERDAEKIRRTLIPVCRLGHEQSNTAWPRCRCPIGAR